MALKTEPLLYSSSDEEEALSEEVVKELPWSSEGESESESESEEEEASEPAKKQIDLSVVMCELMKGSSVPQAVLSHGIALLPPEQRDDFAAKFLDLFRSQLELYVKKRRLLSELRRQIYDALKSKLNQ